MPWIKGELPKKSGNYAVRYNGVEGRDDFSVTMKIWWNTGRYHHPEEVEWDPKSFREIDE